MNLGPILTILIVAGILYLTYSTTFMPSNTKPVDSPLRITVAEARARRFGLIIDVRTPKERELLGFYPESIPISIDQLSSQVPMDISNKKTWILIYSNGDDRAPKAAEILYRMGYTNVRYIKEQYLTLLPGSSY